MRGGEIVRRGGESIRGEWKHESEGENGNMRGGEIMRRGGESMRGRKNMGAELSVALHPPPKIISKLRFPPERQAPFAWSHRGIDDFTQSGTLDTVRDRTLHPGLTAPEFASPSAPTKSDQPDFLPEKEEDFHFLWEHLHFERDGLTTDAGHSVRVLHPGVHNHNQGPDFLNAKIEIDGLEFHGHVELHLKSAEWYQHGHQDDPNYNNVILHVVLAKGKKAARRQDGTLVPELNLSQKIDYKVLSNIRDLRSNPGDAACQAWLGSANHALPPDMATRLGVERIRRKADLMLARMDDLTGDWEQVVWEEIAATLGGPVNGSSFRQLARALPWKIVRKYISADEGPSHRQTHDSSNAYRSGWMAAEKVLPYGKAHFETDLSFNRESFDVRQEIQELRPVSEAPEAEPYDRLELEALFFGMAGMIQDAPAQREPWPLRLRLEWAYLSQKHHLHPIQAPFLFHRMRPGSFPTVRLSQLVSLLNQFSDLADLLNPDSWPTFRNSRIEAGRYWKNHLKFGQRRRARPRRLGQSFKDLVIVNTLAPLAVLYARFHGDAGQDQDSICGASSEDAGVIYGSLESMPPEDNKILRKFKSYGEKPGNALEAQGLLELHKMYCAQSRCLDCRFGRQIVAGKETGNGCATEKQSFAGAVL